MDKQPTSKGPAELFTGDVWIDPLVRAEPPSRVAVNAVHFSPGARTAWHCHAVAQTLYVTQGRGLIQARGGEITQIRPGDILMAKSGEWHWHGAAPDHFMSHISITEASDDPGKPDAEWGDHVTDQEYGDG